MRRYRPRHVYKTHTATILQACSICTNAIEIGEIYMRREVYRDGQHRGALLKCGQCVTIKEVNHG